VFEQKKRKVLIKEKQIIFFQINHIKYLSDIKHINKTVFFKIISNETDFVFE